MPGFNRAGDIFQYLRDGAPRTRVELAEMTGFARSTIVSRIQTLADAGLVMNLGDARSSGGRPAARFAFNPDGRVILGLEVGAERTIVALTNLVGRVIAHAEVETPATAGPVEVLDRARDEGRRLLESIGDRRKDLIGVGVGLPGPVEPSAGRPVQPVALPTWDGFDVVDHLSRAFPVPVLVDNEINLMALGEQRTFWPDSENLLFIRVATGIGMGIIGSGTLQRGADGSAGDLGHIAVGRGSEILCRCGNYGCLEALAGAPAVARSLSGGAEPDVASLIESGRRGDVRASTALRQAGRDIGSVLAGCVNMLNPSVVVLAGPIVEAGDSVLAGIREVVYKRSLPLATARLTIAKSQAMHEVGVIGAALMVAEHVLSPQAIENMLMATRLEDVGQAAVGA